jgi:hypothetical protein
MPLAAGRWVRPVRLPLNDEFAGVDAGVWWDAIAVDGDPGERTAGVTSDTFGPRKAAAS